MKEQIKEVNEFLKIVTVSQGGVPGDIKEYETFNIFKKYESDIYLFEGISLYWVSEKEESYYPNKVTYYGGNGYRFYVVYRNTTMIIAIKTALSDGTLKCISSIRNLEDLKSLMKMNNILNSKTC